MKKGDEIKEEERWVRSREVKGLLEKEVRNTLKMTLQ